MQNKQNQEQDNWGSETHNAPAKRNSETAPLTETLKPVDLNAVDLDTFDFGSLEEEERQLLRATMEQLIVEKSKVPFKGTHSGNAELVIAKYGSHFRYCPGIGFFYWDGKRWRMDTHNIVGAWVKMTLEALPDLVIGDREEITQWQRRSLDKAPRQATLELLKIDGPQVELSELDADDFAFNCSNGIIDLSSGRLLPHDPEKLITQISPVLFDPHAKCAVFEQAILLICGGNRELVRYLQKVFGYLLTGSTREQCLFLFIGKGANGKTLLLEIFAKLLGSYYQHTRPATFLKRENSVIPQDIAKLWGSRMVTASEADQNSQWDEPLLKAATGDNQLTARFLRKQEFTFTPHFKIFLATNHEPHVSGTDDGIWRRMRMLKFTSRFWDADMGESGSPELQADKKLAGKLEAELSGILNWALEGCLAWQSEGLQSPPSVRQDTKAYRYESDILLQFVEEKCELNASFRESKASFYAAFRAWALKNGLPSLTINEVGKIAKNKDFEEMKSGGTRYWKGVKLLDDDTDDTASAKSKEPEEISNEVPKPERPEPTLPSNAPLPSDAPLPASPNRSFGTVSAPRISRATQF